MVVDDDDELRETLGELLESWGYRVCQARDGGEALACLDERQPCVMILDLMMPQMSGWQLLDELKTQKRDLGILVLTATHPEDIPKGYEAFQKPASVLQLMNAVRQHCPT